MRRVSSPPLGEDVAVSTTEDVRVTGAAGAVVWLT
jgi:hypothetical protein